MVMAMREKLIELILSTDLSLSSSRRMDAVNIADHLIANGVTIQEWIHVRDRNRLPDEGEPVLVYTYMNGDQIKAVRRGEKWYSTWDNTPLVYVSHWTPLPESPKGYYDAYA